MFEISRTIGYEMINLRERLGLNITIESNKTVNHKYGVLDNKSLIESSVFPKLRYWGMGIGGSVLGSVRIPNKRNLTLYNLIPVRINSKQDIFEQNEIRSDYRLRVALNSDKIIVPLTSTEITHYAYFLKVVKNTGGNSQLSTSTILENDDSIFEYNSTNIKKYLTGVVDDSISTDIKNGVLKYYNPKEVGEENVITESKLRLNINKNDINSVIKYFDDDTYDKISEIGLFTGLDESITDKTLTYNEAYAIQLSLHSCFLPIKVIHNHGSNYILNYHLT